MDWSEYIPITTEKKHVIYLRKAYSYAWLQSEDPSTKTGAILFDEKQNKIIAYGANHYSPGLNPTEEQMQDRDYKLSKIIHAEPSAVHYAAKHGRATNGSTMYMPWAPCDPCANVIADAGITKLIGHKAMIDKTPENWLESTVEALNTLKKNKVEFFMYDGRIGGVDALFRGEEWKP